MSVGARSLEANISADVGLDFSRGKYPRIPCLSGQGASRPTSVLMLASTPHGANTLGYHVCWGREHSEEWKYSSVFFSLC